MIYSNLDPEKRSIKEFNERQDCNQSNCYLLEPDKQLSDSNVYKEIKKNPLFEVN